MLLKGFQTVLGFAEDVVHFCQTLEVTHGEPFLIWDEDVGLRGSDPPGEDAFHKDVGIEAGLLGKKGKEGGSSPTMADCDPVANGLGDGADEGNIAVQPDSIGASDKIDFQRSPIHDRRRMLPSWRPGNGKFTERRWNRLVSRSICLCSRGLFTFQ